MYKKTFPFLKLSLPTGGNLATVGVQGACVVFCTTGLWIHQSRRHTLPEANI